MNKQDYIESFIGNGGDRQLAAKLTIEQLVEATNTLKKEKREKELTLQERAKEEFEEGRAKIVEVTRSYSRKIQIKQFEPVDVFCSFKAEVTEDCDIKAVSNQLYYDCRLMVAEEIRDLQSQVEKSKKKLQKNEQDFINSL